MIIGVFDSGRGGEILAQDIAEAFPEHQVITYLDVENVPYGSKAPDEIHRLTKIGLDDLITRGANILVLACNTASTIVHLLRKEIKVPIVGLEPMIKPAAQLTKSGVIAVFATPATLAAANYQRLKQEYASDCTVLEPDCGKWSTMIQREAIDWATINQTTQEMLEQAADVLVLGCTHYHILEDKLLKLVDGRAQVLQPSQAIIQQIGKMLDATYA